MYTSPCFAVYEVHIIRTKYVIFDAHAGDFGVLIESSHLSPTGKCHDSQQWYDHIYVHDTGMHTYTSNDIIQNNNYWNINLLYIQVCCTAVRCTELCLVPPDWQRNLPPTRPSRPDHIGRGPPTFALTGGGRWKPFLPYTRPTYRRTSGSSSSPWSQNNTAVCCCLIFSSMLSSAQPSIPSHTTPYPHRNPFHAILD